MSIFSRGPALRLPSISSGATTWPQDCVLCLAPSVDALCSACEGELPWLRAACVRCALALPITGVCGRCTREAPHFDAARACFEYRFPLDRLVQRFKFAGDLALGRWLGERLAARVRDEAGVDLIVVPPLSAARLRERGFNQALEMAKRVARSLGVASDTRALARVRETEPQPGLGRAERAANLRGAFRCDADVKALHVAIVDDVLTTGATADALARVLKRAGAARVSVWAAARTPLE
jgi:ComF family protein